MVDKRVSLLLELGASKVELSDFWAEASKEKKALEEAFDAGFDAIFNYGYGCCAFARNICGSELVILDGMSDTSKSLPPEFFINPRCPLSVASGVPTTDPDADVREAGKSFPATEVGLGIQFDSPVRVTRENKETYASGGNSGVYFIAVSLALYLTHYIPGFRCHATEFLNKACVVLKIYCCCFLSIESSNLLCLAG